MPLIYRSGFFLLLFLLVFVAWGASELLGPGRWQHTPGSQRKDGGSSVVLTISAGTGALLLFLFPLLLPQTTLRDTWQGWFFWSGAVFVLLGVWLRWSAIRTLGIWFTGSVMVAQQQRIVQHGPYRLIRHPSYSGILLIVMGIGLMLTNWASFLSLTLGMLIGLLYRMSVEERALAPLPGYASYRRRTKRLIPCLD